MTKTSAASSLYESNLSELERINQGKVRDIYAVDEEHMLIVTTDRLSAFDVVLPDAIPLKGEVLTDISNFWFHRTESIIPNHLSDLSLTETIRNERERKDIASRAVVVRRLKALPIEAVVRGYLIGSGWKDYQRSGAVCGIQLQPGLRMADKLPAPLFTPSTKAAVGEHDENISYAEAAGLLGENLARQVKDTALELYRFGSDYARERGIIIADTKFEFGLDREGALVLIDEVLTPDSSRFWPADAYQPSTSPPSFDKQYVRDYLETLDWDKKPPGPKLPDEIIQKTSEKYQTARSLITGVKPGSD